MGCSTDDLVSVCCRVVVMLEGMTFPDRVQEGHGGGVRTARKTLSGRGRGMASCTEVVPGRVQDERRVVRGMVREG